MYVFISFYNTTTKLTTSQFDSMIPSGSMPGGPLYAGDSLPLGPFLESPDHCSSFLQYKYN